jgi:hypothetical protein
MSTLATLTQYSTGSFIHRYKTKKEIKGKQIRRQLIKFPVFAHDMILFIEKPTDFTKALLI